MQIRRWLDALDRFEHTGDYGVFAPLLRADGVPDNRATHLEAAAFLERTLNVQGAARELEAFLPVLDQPLRGASLMFQDRLAACLRWAKASKLSEQQRKLAFRYLSRRDFVRAAMFGKEACVSQACEKRYGSTTLEFSRKDRENAEIELERELKNERGRRSAAYWSLTHVRNALAHGVRPPEYIEDALKTPQKLQAALEKALEGFFDGDVARTSPPPHHVELQRVRQGLTRRSGKEA